MLKTLSDALSLLDYFNSAQTAWGVRELAKASGMHHAVVQRMLATFADKGVLVQDPENRKYLPGVRLFELGQLARMRLHLSDIIRPIMLRLAEEEKETVFLTVLERDRGICAEIAESQSPIKFSIDVGASIALYHGAHAKVILAYLPQELQQRLLEAPDSPFRDDIARIEKILQTIREQGWCASHGEYDKETFGIAIPLFSHAGNIIGSLGIAGPLFRFNPENTPQQVALLLKEQPAVQRALDAFGSSSGYSP